MVTIKDVAQKAGVSIGTVDRVLHGRSGVNENTRERVLNVVKELNYVPNIVAQGLAVNKKKLKFVFIIPNSSRNPFFVDVKRAVENKADKMKQFGVQVVLCTMQLDGSIEEGDIKQIVAQADGLVTIGYELPGVIDAIETANEHHIPIVFYNHSLPQYDYLAYVGADYIASGRLAAGLIALAGGEDAKIGIFSQGPVIVDSYLERVEGLRKEIAERYQNMKILGEQNISLDPEENRLAVTRILQKHPEMNVAYIVNPADYEICEEIAAQDPEHNIQIITYDLVEKQIDMLQRGVIAATVCQEPRRQGDQSLDILYRYLAYGEKPMQKDQFTYLSIHIAQNC